MNNEIKKEKCSEYYSSMHRLGRIMIIGSIIGFIGVPILVCLKFNILPSFKEVLLGASGLLAIFVPAALSEILAYTPIMGSSTYLSFITGNVMNLKIPSVLNAYSVAEVAPGTEEGDAIAGVAVAISSLVTMLIIALGVLLLVPLKPILALPAVKTAVEYVLPALFGALTLQAFNRNVGGGIVIEGRTKSLIIPAIIALVLFLLIPVYYSLFQGVVIILFIPLIYYSNKYLYNKGQIKVKLPDEIVENKE